VRNQRFSKPEREAKDENLIDDIRDIRLLPDRVRIIDPRPDVAEHLKNRIIPRGELYDLVQESNLDLYCVGKPEGQPPVYKLIDYGKFKFEEQKRKREMERKQRENHRTTKEIQFSPNIGEHDIDVKVGHIRDLLDEHDVRIYVKLNRHNRFLLTGRYRHPLEAAVKQEDFVLRRVASKLVDDAMPFGLMSVGAESVSLLLRKRVQTGKSSGADLTSERVKTPQGGEANAELRSA